MDDDIEDEQRLKLEDEAVNSFTSARSIDELEYEISELRELVSLARQVEQSQTETKLEELRKVLEESKIFQNENEKLLIFTEHRDTLEYLFEKLQSWGLRVTQIHGLMRMDERIRAQEESGSAGMP